MNDITINDVVYFRLTPEKEWSCIEPFTAQITSRVPLNVQEKAYIQEALVNAAVKIKLAQGRPDDYNFVRYPREVEE